MRAVITRARRSLRDREDEAATFEEIDMKNAHARFGALEFVKRTKDTTTLVRVHIDRAVLETPKDERGQAAVHLVSMIGGDAEIGALWAFWSTVISKAS